MSRKPVPYIKLTTYTTDIIHHAPCAIHHTKRRQEEREASFLLYFLHFYHT